jgi:flagellar motility protein MotE (MotC chaperone)
MRFLRDLRLIPVVALAAAALFLLKATSIVIEGGYTLIASRAAMAQGLGEGVKGDEMPPPAPLDDVAPAKGVVRGDRANDNRANNDRANDNRANAWVRDIYQAPSYASPKTDGPEYTGSVAAPKPEGAPEPPKDGGHGAAPAPDKNITTTPPEPIKPAVSAGERAVLESLQQRRQELETRTRENEVRDSLLKAAEKRIEQRMQELKEMESRLQGTEKKKDEEDASKFKSLVTMYENMKAKDAAKIFDRLDLRVLIEIANAMNPRRMSDILGQMSPEAAERLTIEIANRSGAIGKSQGNGPAELPKIEGRPKS